MLIEEMTLANFEAVRDLLASTPGISLRSADGRDSIARYLERNPGLSFVAREDGRIVGCAMSGHDGRRGYLQHLAVAPEMRRRGIGAALVERCIESLHRAGIDKTHIEVFTGNQLAHHFWTRAGWKKRDDIVRYSFICGPDRNP
jgi:ribosomal protein S18 acetylase RimI-like enzyme